MVSAGPAPTRRGLLLGSLLTGPALLAACSTSAPPSPVPPDPDDLLRSAAAGRERALLDAYDAAVLAQPDRAVLLLSLRAHHEQHLALLTGPPASASPGTSASPSAAGIVTPVGLVALERATAAAHAEAAVAARDHALAGLLASLSASESTHPVALAPPAKA